MELQADYSRVFVMLKYVMPRQDCSQWVADLDMIQRILVNDLDLAPYERLCCSIVMSDNVLTRLSIAAATLPDLAALALQLLQLLPVIAVAHIFLIWTAVPYIKARFLCLFLSEMHYIKV